MVGERPFIIFLLIAVFSFLVKFSCFAADWKFLGIAQIKETTGKSMAFFDSDSIQRLSNGHVRAWFKVLDESDMMKFNNANKKELVKVAADKTTGGYIPPYLLLKGKKKVNSKEKANLTTWEEIAKSNEIKARAMFLYEINCSEKTIRTLSVNFYNPDGSSYQTGDYDQWSQIIPKSNSETLHMILCRKK